MAGTGRFTRAGLTQAGTDLSLAAFYALFAWAHWVAFRSQPRPSLVLLVVVETILAAFVLLRRPSQAASRLPWDWITAAGGSLAPLLLRPGPAVSDLAAGEVIQVAGTLLTVAGVLSLNRSFGIVPAQRGVQTGGLYRLVRHPLYLSYTLSQIGYLISNGTLWNMVVVAVAWGLQLVRIANEERFLSRYPEYREYQRRTRWRIVPFIY